MRVFAVSRHENFIPSGKQNHMNSTAPLCQVPLSCTFPISFLYPFRPARYRGSTGDIEAIWNRVGAYSQVPQTLLPETAQRKILYLIKKESV